MITSIWEILMSLLNLVQIIRELCQYKDKYDEKIIKLPPPPKKKKKKKKQADECDLANKGNSIV